ncbi:hypothetical protein KYK30_13435 [Shinella yambaruensis]|uniref:Uncharacterized protein n=1 Tax=Shinella yambaruensis TaxID=415996 RepID=A0ABQ5Z9U8_9HYPH|nr:MULTISPECIES: hypothetical protein [Shinella]CAI0337317.1 hypothetical protein SHINE37_41171 [Rhizobiaceae bacterium]CAK7255811.1 protein of unknown function [Shinella sp. WSC3-e]MCJ8024262.1 hypothetical protein [Shinella yambaruensis]MCU7980704.1 hypothetical protein [Shinella yambaruensis]MDC7254594.1 hypothetical protein [Shinella sp. YE25]
MSGGNATDAERIVAAFAWPIVPPVQTRFFAHRRDVAPASGSVRPWVAAGKTGKVTGRHSFD